MEIKDLDLPGVKLLKLQTFRDERGFFRESYNKRYHASMGVVCDFVQDNHSFSLMGAIRGMHFQRSPGQAKLVTVMEGTIYDVVVDIRKSSPTFKKWIGVYLDAAKGDQLFVPVGYAHGFCVVSSKAHVSYKVSHPYDPLEEKGFRSDDPEIGIVWPLDAHLLSDRDRASPFFQEVLDLFQN